MKIRTCSLAVLAAAALLVVAPRADAALTSKLAVADQGSITHQTAGTSTSKHKKATKHKATKHGATRHYKAKHAAATKGAPAKKSQPSPTGMQ
jgi:hypothetical protein